MTPGVAAGTITHLYRQILLAQVPGDTADHRTDIVLDVGSNLGFYSLLPARLGFRAIAFDMQAPPALPPPRTLPHTRESWDGGIFGGVEQRGHFSRGASTIAHSRGDGMEWRLRTCQRALSRRPSLLPPSAAVPLSTSVPPPFPRSLARSLPSSPPASFHPPSRHLPIQRPLRCSEGRARERREGEGRR